MSKARGGEAGFPVFNALWVSPFLGRPAAAGP
jgi:hypothetical protein